MSRLHKIKKGNDDNVPLIGFFFFFPDFSFSSKKKKKWKQRRFSGFNGSSNWVVTDLWIDKNWKLEYWIDKIES